MKVLLFCIALLLSAASFSQTNKQPVPKIDSTKSAQASDSTILFSVKDLVPIFEQLKKQPYETAAPIIAYLQKLIGEKAKEWEIQHAKKKE